jgi:hypothetical protein
MKQCLSILLFFFLAITVNGQGKKYPENFGGIFHSKSLLLGKNIFKGDVGYSVSKVSYRDSMTALKEYYRQSARINFSINPWRDLYIRNIFYIDLNYSDIAPPWLSDYFYQVGYYNWRNKTFSFGYENYQPNVWNTVSDDFITNLKRGFFFVSYNLVISTSDKKTLRPLFWDKTSKIIFTPVARLHPEYPDEYNGFGGNLKTVIGTNIRYVILKNIYVETALFYYPLAKTILHWDPDFTYGFGIYDWRAFKLNFSYGNWIANRFPWNKKELDDYGFLNGEFNISFSYSW